MPQRTHTPISILVVDDSNTIRFLTQQQLQGLGFQVDLASDGLSAIEKFSQKAYALILMDVQMPSFDGLETTAAIRKLETEQQSPTLVPIIAMTANPNRERFLASGMSDFIFKPVMLEDLKTLLDRWLPADVERKWLLPN